MIELDTQDKQVIDRLADKFPQGKQASCILMALNACRIVMCFYRRTLDAVASYLVCQQLAYMRLFHSIVYTNAPDAPVNLGMYQFILLFKWGSRCKALS